METCLDPSHSPRPGWFLFCKVAAWLTSKLPSLLLFSYKHLLSNSCVPGTVMGTGHGELSKIRHLLEEKAGQEDRCPHQCLLSLWLPPSVFFCPYLHCLCAWLTCSSYSYPPTSVGLSFHYQFYAHNSEFYIWSNCSSKLQMFLKPLNRHLHLHAPLHKPHMSKLNLATSRVWCHHLPSSPNQKTHVSALSLILHV